MLLLVVFTLEVAAGVLGFVYKDKVKFVRIHYTLLKAYFITFLETCMKDCYIVDYKTL